jgi:hypothetical protein
VPVAPAEIQQEGSGCPHQALPDSHVGGIVKKNSAACSKSLRFDVFKRDSFTCQYCGHKAPDVLLELDHIIPRAKGGETNLLNLLTACQDCNRGKSAKTLSENSTLEKQRRQLEALQERREQLTMMLEWQKELSVFDDESVSHLARAWDEVVPGYSVNETGRRRLKALLSKFSFQEVLTAIGISACQYFQAKPSHEAADLTFNKLGGICRIRQLSPEQAKLYYIRGILRKRLANYCDEHRALRMMREAHDAGVGIAELEEAALSSSNWTQWRLRVEELTAAQTE